MQFRYMKQSSLATLAVILLGLMLALCIVAGEVNGVQRSFAGVGASATPVTVVPTPVDEIDSETSDTTKILLLGSDTSNPANAGRTDTIMMAVVHRGAESVSLLSIPRDLFVYIPGFGMERINTVFGLGERSEVSEGGYGLLQEVLEYNLGLSFDIYARVDFNEFQTLVDALGGIELTVDCALQDWQLISPELDPGDEENWEMVTLPVGVHTLSGYEALWYARSRRTSSDFDRGRRQQEIVRAIWRRASELGLLNQLPVMWHELTNTVETNMGPGDLLDLLPFALNLDAARISHFRFQPDVHVRAWRTPGGAAVQLPVGENVVDLVQAFLQPVTDNQLVTGATRVEIVNATGYRHMDRVAADLLAWEGFSAVALGDATDVVDGRTHVTDFSGQQKGGRLDDLLAALRIGADRVTVSPTANMAADYRIVLGRDFRSCRHNVLPPQPVAIPGS